VGAFPREALLIGGLGTAGAFGAHRLRLALDVPLLAPFLFHFLLLCLALAAARLVGLLYFVRDDTFPRLTR
jgi:hypothetical protein